MLKLEAKKREQKEKVIPGEIPAVYYGRMEKSTPISVVARDFKKLWDDIGESSVFSLKVSDKDMEALIHDVDTHPVSGEPRHVDFYVIEKGKKINVSIPLEFVGIAPAVKELGGVLVKVLHEVEVETLPKDLPRFIEVDTSSLASFDDQITIEDIKLPEGVLITSPNADDIVVMVHEAKEEVVEEEVAPDLASIEVEKKGKEETTEGEAETKEVKE